MPENSFSCPYCLTVLQATVAKKYESYLCTQCRKVFLYNPELNSVIISELTVTGLPEERVQQQLRPA